MPDRNDRPDTDTVAQIKSVLASMLALDLESIDEQHGLARYGLDSVSRAELSTLLSERQGCDLPPSLLSGNSSIETLARFIDDAHRSSRSCRDSMEGMAPLDRMRADSLLPDDVFPPRQPWDGRAETLLITGATGFLGIHVLAALLRSTDCTICCLVRAANESAGYERLIGQMRKHRLQLPMVRDRIRVFCGDLNAARLGVADAQYRWLSAKVDLIYHCGAAVDWISGYEDLRVSNVASVLSVLRLAQEVKVKPLHFLSSLGVCYSTSGPDLVDESDAMMKCIDGIHLGYFQTKVVAETLLFEARTRGFPVTIYRPALITGSSETGICNEQDLVSRMITGCIAMGAAPDLDWEFDCCPVDFAASAVTRLSRERTPPGRVYHLRHPDARHWREVVLCMNACGYRVRLAPYRAWLDELEAAARHQDHPLYALRSFFNFRVNGSELTLPELYERHRRSKVDSKMTDAAIDRHRLRYPPLEPRLFEGYIRRFADAGLLPHRRAPTARRAGAPRIEKSASPAAAVVRSILRAERLRCDGLSVERVRGEASIISDLTAWQSGVDAGLYRCKLHIDGGANGWDGGPDLFLKVKARDAFALTAGASVAALSGERLYRAYREHCRYTGLVGTHRRELWLYRRQPPQLSRYLPRLCGTMEDSARGIWALLMEDLAGRAWMDERVTPNRWDGRRIGAVIDGLADLHAAWFDRVDELIDERAMKTSARPGDYPGAMPLWEELALQAVPWLDAWAGAPVVEAQQRLVGTVPLWCGELDSMRRTLIHNDCNPRNIAIREPERRARLCLFDWELAAIGVPQRDSAEFLCFVLHDAVSESGVDAFVDRHRLKLQEASGHRINEVEWRRGFLLSLRDLMVNRIPFYLMIHRAKRQHYLPHVVRNWYRLYRQFSHPGDDSSRVRLGRSAENGDPSHGGESPLSGKTPRCGA